MGNGSAIEWDGLEVSVDGGKALFRRGEDRLYLLNETARTIWDARRSGQSASRIALELAARFDIDPDRAQKDVRRALSAWREAGLLDGSPARPPQGDAAASSAAEASPAAPGHCLDQCLERHCYRLGRLHFVVDYQHGALLSALHPLLEHLAVETPGDTSTRLFVRADEQGFALRSARRLLCRQADVGSFTLAAMREINILAARSLDPALVLHAAAVGRAGRSILLPGASGCGKSTLAAAMALAGFDYLGDDIVAVLPHSHRLAPLPTSLNLKPGSLAPLRAAFGPLRTIRPVDAGPHAYRFLPPPGRVVRGGQWRIVAVVFPRFGAAGTAMERLSGAKMLEMLVASTASFRQVHGGEAMVRLLEWLTKLPAWRMEYGALGEGKARLEEILEAPLGG